MEAANDSNNNNNNNKAQLETFCALTSSTPEEAIFFLESHNWDLDSAVSTFFENNTTTEFPPPPGSTVPIMSSSSSRGGDKKPKPTKKPVGGIHTLSDLKSDHGHGSDSDDDSDGPQEYYTGGQKSGMLVQDPSKNKGNDVDSIFSQARQLGAMEGPAAHVHPSSSSRSFTGTGRLLSGEPAPSVAVAPEPPQSVVHNIFFWRNGFTVDDGPLRTLADPENAPFLESITKSECPEELAPADRRTQVTVNLIKKDENFTEPEKRHVPFQGVGRTLGSTSAAPTSAVTAPAPVTASAPVPLNTAPSRSIGLVVDQALPSTSIQLRLADGTRMVARFNYHHTVNDIRAFIDASRPGSPRTYHLQTVGFPPKQLTDASQTIEQAGLLNSVVIQKL
ncbi:hypothetical protein IFM89_028708 [Coptis chinensis]|uniref:Uncharacterized protein n=1 Tax=Coptis chinensis TaxID=261450 RepID=A0A835I6F0_9MAGN|nr:hypothetical protein IFM89_028708 [Coptis chinensis]